MIKDHINYLKDNIMYVISKKGMTIRTKFKTNENNDAPCSSMLYNFTFGKEVVNYTDSKLKILNNTIYLFGDELNSMGIKKHLVKVMLKKLNKKKLVVNNINVIYNYHNYFDNKDDKKVLKPNNE